MSRLQGIERFTLPIYTNDVSRDDDDDDDDDDDGGVLAGNPIGKNLLHPPV